MGNVNEDLAAVINAHGLENGSNTPDFLLARFLERCITTWDRATRERDDWYLGRMMAPGEYKEREALQEQVAGLRRVVRRLAGDFNELEALAGYTRVSLQDRLERIADDACIPREWLEEKQEAE
jgi:hypothetical protein